MYALMPVAIDPADPAFAAALFGGVFAPELLPELRRIADEFCPAAVVHPPTLTPLRGLARSDSLVSSS